MCGIVSVVLKNPEPVKDYLLKPLKQLEYRGYDSCGYFVTDFDQPSSQRAIGPVDTLTSNAKVIQGIAHTRWATHGEVTIENSHPQSSGKRIHIVHNGVVDNYQEIKSSLVLKGYIFESETDTEVIAHLIHFYVNNLSVQYPTSTAVCMAMMDLKGKFSFIALDNKTKTIVAVNNGRPLIVFRDNESTTIASDVAAFIGKSSGEIYYLKEGEVCEMNDNEQKIRRVRLHGGTRVQEKIVSDFHSYTPESEAVIEKMRTIMESEIHQQSTAVENTLKFNRHLEIAKAFSSLLTHPDHIKKIALVGCGTSYHAAQMGAKWLKMIAGVDATAYISSEFANQSGFDSDTSLFIFLSQSGETADTLTAIEQVNLYASHKTVAICNTPQSEIVRNCKYSFFTQAGTERSVASTKAFTCQLVVLLKVALALGSITKRGMGSISFITNDIDHQLDSLPALINETLVSSSIKAKIFCDQVNPKKSPTQTIFLARDILYPITLEGALKLAEIAYIPSLTYFTGEIKHGPLALVDSQTPVIVSFSPSESNLTKMFSSLNQIQARGGRLILVSNAPGLEMAKVAGIKTIATFEIPTISRYQSVIEPILTIIPLQLIAHELALKLKKNVDRPRNLAKSVTVE